MNDSNLEIMAESTYQQVPYSKSKRKKKELAGIVAPPILMGVMALVYYFVGIIFGRELGWYLGLVVYWMLCGLLFSAWLIGIRKTKELSSPRKLKLKFIPIIIFPVIMAFLFSYFTGIEYTKVDLVGIILLVTTSIGNGIFEEILWRGAYMDLYPDNFFLRIIYPTFWYAIFHFASGISSSNSRIIGLVIGSAFFGLYLALIAKWTNTIWWSILCHILGGFVMIA
jgi:membrane protease YdiL (CAAX protease family)